MKNTCITGPLFLGLFLIGATSFARELIVGGNMENASDWTVVDVAAGNGHTETFNYTDDGPTGGSGGCLSMAGSGNWPNAAACQEITVKRGTTIDFSSPVAGVYYVVVTDLNGNMSTIKTTKF